MNKENRMETQAILPLLMSLSLPPMLSMLVQSLYNIVDSVFVAQISKESLTAVSLAFPIQSLIVAFAVGTGVGVNSYISRQLGAKNQDKANQAILHGMIIAAFFSLLFLVLSFIIVKPFFKSFTDDPQILEAAMIYTRIVMIFSFTSFFHILIEKVFQATGKMMFPTVIQIIGALINIILDPIFIFGYFGLPAMGVKGAAIATIIGQASAMTISLAVLLKMKHDVWIDLENFKFDIAIIKEILNISVPNTMMNALPSVLNMGLNGLLIQFSTSAVAVFGVYFKLQTFVFMPASGLSQGAMPLMGYSYGAHAVSRLQETIKYNVLITFFIMLIGTLIFNLFPQELLSIFKADQEMIELGIPALRLISFSFIPATLGYSLPTFFQAVGYGKESMTVFLLRQLVITLPLSFILSQFIGLNGVWLSFLIAETFAGFVALLLFRSIKKSNPVLQTLS